MLDVSLDITPFTRWLGAQAKRNVPFAAARSLTHLAKYGQDETRSGMRSALTIRRPWAEKGIQVKAAQRKDGLANMQAEVGSKDWFMADQLADASSVRKAPGGRKQFLPKAARKSKASIIPTRLRPKAVTAASKSEGAKFFFRSGAGGRSAVFQKMRGDRLKLLYTTGDQQTIKPKLSLNATVSRVVLQRGQQEFLKQLEAAIRSAR